MCTMRSYHITIIDNPYFKKIAPFQPALTTIKQARLNKLWDEVRVNKVDVEARYSTILLLYVLSSGMYLQQVENINNVPEPLTPVIRKYYSIVRDIAIEVLRDAFETGYRLDDCEKNVKKAFSVLLEFFLPSAIAICKSVENGGIDENGRIDILQKAEYDAYLEAVRRRLRRDGTPTTYISKIARKYDNNSNSKGLEDFLNTVSSSIGSLIPEGTTQEYIFELVKKCITQAGAFNKNDILDAMILGTLEKNGAFLTADKGIIDHMMNYKSNRMDYNMSLEEIERLKEGLI